MHVHITYTGGTIGMVDSPHGLVPGANLEGWLDSLLKGTPLARSVSVTSLAPLIDSSNATPLSWQAIVDDLRAHAAADPRPGRARSSISSTPPPGAIRRRQRWSSVPRS